MGISRQRMATTRGIQSRRRIRFCLSDNEQERQEEIRWKEILLESKDPTDNEKEEKT
jgi:hypothetical protein